MTEGSGTVGDRYVLGEPLGRGGMAEVHRATDLRLNRQVAVKRLAPELAADPVAQTRFRREAQAAARLNHPAIAAVFDTGADVDPVTGASIPFIVMELVEGPTLRQVLADQAHLPPERALALIRDVLDALAHSHAAGIVHRDIKPANVMLTAAGQVKVMDFGIARAVDDSTSGGLTQTAAVVGTAHYLSPEQARGERVDPRSDLYAAGCLLYALLVGTPPFVGESSLSVAYQHVREAADAPSVHEPGINPHVDALVAKALAKDPGQRYQDAREMQADIDRVLAGVPVVAPLTPAVQESTEPIPAPTAIQPAATPAVLAPPTPSPPLQPAIATESPADASAVNRSEEPRRRSPVGWILVVVLLVVAMLGGFGIYRFLNPSGSTVAVPQVVGRSRADAERELTSAGLTARFAETRGPDGATVGTATKQLPTADTDVARRSVVTVTINTGPASGGTKPATTTTAPTTGPSHESSSKPSDRSSADASIKPTESTSAESESPRASASRSPSASASETGSPSASASASASSSASTSAQPSPSVSARSKPAKASAPSTSDPPSSPAPAPPAPAPPAPAQPASGQSASTSARGGATADSARSRPSAPGQADDLT
ncbi:MAG: Stk1 family PASTA domain-containing Ser/Thr kinase [Propionibacteriaceae bacterium]